jgi:hypothetical protein
MIFKIYLNKNEIKNEKNCYYTFYGPTKTKKKYKIQKKKKNIGRK